MSIVAVYNTGSSVVVNVDIHRKTLKMASMNKKELQKQIRLIMQQLEQLHDQLNSSETEGQQLAEKRAAKGLCTFCGEPLGNEKPQRGAHPRCYRKVNRSINNKICTEAQAISRGWLLTPAKGGRKVTGDDPIGQMFNESRSKKSRRRV